MVSIVFIAVLITMLVVIPALLIVSNKTAPGEQVDVDYLDLFTRISDYQICGESGIKEIVNVSNENECAEKCVLDSQCDSFNYYPNRFPDSDKPNGCGINIEEGGCDLSNRYIVSETTLSNKPALPTPMQQLGNRVSYLRTLNYGDITEPGGFSGSVTANCNVNESGTGYFLADKRNQGKCRIPFIHDPKNSDPTASVPGTIKMLSDQDKSTAMNIPRWVPFNASDGTLAFTIGPGPDVADPMIMIKYQMVAGSIEKFALLINMHENDLPGEFDSRLNPHAYMLLSEEIISANTDLRAQSKTLTELIGTNFPNYVGVSNNNVKIFEYEQT